MIQKILKLIDRLFDLLPTIQCVHCDRWFGKKGVEYHRMTTGWDVPVCHKCWVEINKFIEVE